MWMSYLAICLPRRIKQANSENLCPPAIIVYYLNELSKPGFKVSS